MAAFAFRSNGVFGKSLDNVQVDHPGVKFFFEWVSSIKDLHNLNCFKSDLERYRQYYELRKSINLKPTPLPSGMDDEFNYYLIYDYLRQIPTALASTFFNTIQLFGCNY